MKRLVLALSLVGCGGARSPEGAVRALAEAAESGSRDDVWRLIGPATRARLTADAAHAAAAAGRRDVGPRDLLAVGWSPPRWHIVGIDVIARQGDRATVEVRGEAHQRQSVTCVYVERQWHVELE
jgi:hypothetical protein